MTKKEIKDRFKILGDSYILPGFGTRLCPIDITSLNIMYYITYLFEMFYLKNAEIYIPSWMLWKIYSCCYGSAKHIIDNINIDTYEVAGIKLKIYKDDERYSEKSLVYINSDDGERFGIFDYCAEP